MNLAAQEAIWLRNFIVEVNTALTGKSFEESFDDTPEVGMHFTTLGPTFILCDNLGAVHTAANPVGSKRSEHVDIRYLKIREYQEQQRLVIKHIDGNKNVADMFTKPLARPAFRQYLDYIGLSDPQTRAKMKKFATA